MKEVDQEKREEALLVIELWRESGLSQGTYCKQEDIARSTFQHWRKRYDPSYEYQSKKKKSIPKKSKERFIPVEMKEVLLDNDVLSVKSTELEIIYTNSVRIKCSSDLAPMELQKLIRLEI